MSKPTLIAAVKAIDGALDPFDLPSKTGAAAVMFYTYARASGYSVDDLMRVLAEAKATVDASLARTES